MNDQPVTSRAAVANHPHRWVALVLAAGLSAIVIAGAVALSTGPTAAGIVLLLIGLLLAALTVLLWTLSYALRGAATAGELTGKVLAWPPPASMTYLSSGWACAWSGGVDMPAPKVGRIRTLGELKLVGSTLTLRVVPRWLAAMFGGAPDLNVAR